MKPDVLLQRPPKRESLKVAAGVSRGERGAGEPRGRWEGARVLCALARTWCWVLHRPMQALHESALLTAEEWTARRGSCPWLRVLKGIGCVAEVNVAWLVQRANEISGEGGAKILPESVSCSAIAYTKMICPEKLNGLILYPS